MTPSQLQTVVAVFAVLLTGCFKPTDEQKRDSGGGPIADGGQDKICGGFDDAGRAFVTNYGPELAGCTVLQGSLEVCRPSDLTELQHLRALRVIEGGFAVDRCLQLANLDGVERLERLKQLGLFRSPLLQDLRAFTSLQGITEQIVVDDMKGLLSLRGLERTESLNVLSIGATEKLESLDGLQGLRVVGGGLRGGLLDISYNASLRSLKELSVLKLVEGPLYIKNNPKLPRSEIDAFLARVQVTGPVTISGNGP